MLLRYIGNNILNPDYVIGFVMSGVITIKSGYLETES